MKANTKFPYDVKSASGFNFELKELPSNENLVIYKFEVPDGFLNEAKYKALDEPIMLVAEVNCSATFYRELFTSSNLKYIEITILKENIFDKLTIDFIIIFTSDTHWDNIPINPGMPICHLGSFKIDFNSRASGLISFVPDNDSKIVWYSFSDNSININLPVQKFDWLLMKRNNPLIKKILTSQLAQIALIEACQKMGNNVNDHLYWYQELTHRWKNFSKDDKVFPEYDDIPEFVNHILHNPSDSLIDFLMQNQIINE